MKKIILGFMVLCSSIFAGEITVAAAANVTYAMDKLVKEFNVANYMMQISNTLLQKNGILLFPEKKKSKGNTSRNSR